VIEILHAAQAGAGGLVFGFLAREVVAQGFHPIPSS
jgi:hypothetical protein